MSITLQPAFRERLWGEFEGQLWNDMLKHKEVKRRIDEYFALAPKDRFHQKIFPATESDAEVMERFLAEMLQISKLNLGKKFCIVTHGGPLKTLLEISGYYTDKNDHYLRNTGHLIVESDGVSYSVKEVVGLEKKVEIND